MTGPEPTRVTRHTHFRNGRDVVTVRTRKSQLPQRLDTPYRAGTGVDSVFRTRGLWAQSPKDTLKGLVP